ncbi:MAG: ZIP family metal transporter [Halobacteriaceae archaeon]
MATPGRHGVPRGRAAALGLGVTMLLVALSGYAMIAGVLGKLVGIAWVAFLGMASAAALGTRARSDHPRGQVWGYGLAAGAMITSAAVFLVPQAVTQAPRAAGFGLAAGLLLGFAGHTIGHRLTHLGLPIDRTAAELTAHAIAAGVIIGVVYAAMPSLGPLLGLAIVSHKGPAGFAAARRLSRAGTSPVVLLLPSAALGVSALAAGLLQPPTGPVFRGVLFGFATGIFLHVAMDFLPSCETGSEVHDAVTRSASTDAHARLDALRLHAVASTVLGGLAVFLAWLLVVT